jgi:raffinose/stachyose/melibiose transport system permease protein
MPAHRLKKEAPYLLFVLPAFLIYTTLTILPTLTTFLYSFTNYDGLSPHARFIGIMNYVKVMTTGNVVNSLKNSIVYGFVTPLLVTLLAIPLALVLNGRMRTRNMQRSIFFFPSVISALFVGYIWNFILSPSSQGLINGLLEKAGAKKLLLLADPHQAMGYLILVSVWCTVGWHACIYLANLQVIPTEYYEASYMDGAGPFNRFRHITLPMLAPAMTTSVMLLITGNLKAFDLPFALTNGGPGYVTTMITQTIITEGVSANRVGFASAMSFIFFVMIMIVTMVQLRVMRAREENLS